MKETLFDRVNDARRAIQYANCLGPNGPAVWFDWGWNAAFLYEGDLSKLRAPEGYEFEWISPTSILVKEKVIRWGIFPATLPICEILDCREWDEDKKHIDNGEPGM